MVNVLHAMLLTDGPRLVKTPTYHVFDLYSDHQDAEWVDAVADDVDPFLDWTVSHSPPPQASVPIIPALYIER